jgi:hypothetical protein
MATKIEKLKDLNYDEVSALNVIEKDEDLHEIFTDEVKISFNLLRTLSEEDKLSQDTKDFIKEIFDKLILTKSNLINKYVLEVEAIGKTVSVITEPEPQIEEEEEEEEKELEEVEDKGSKKLPRRYGKVYIERDIKAQGGKATNAQLTALAVNDLKNVWIKLSSRMVSELLSGEPKMTDEEYREIRSAIKIVENKLKPILNKK